MLHWTELLCAAVAFTAQARGQGGSDVGPKSACTTKQLPLIHPKVDSAKENNRPYSEGRNI